MILHHQFIKMAKKFSKKMAIIDCTTEKRVPYSKALIASLILAKKFKKYNDKYIGVMIPTSAGSFLTTIGLLMAGKVPVMINYSTGAAINCRYAQKKCGFKTIIVSKALIEKIQCRPVKGFIYIEDIMETIGLADKLGAALKSKMSCSSIINTLPKATADDNIVILFTSGSEKEPKAVQLTHKNLGSNIEGIMEAIPLTSDDSIMSILPLFHVFGFNTNFWLPMSQGMTAVTYANPLDYKRIPKIIREERPTMITGTPIFFNGFLREASPGDFNSIVYMVPGADKTPAALRKGYKEQHNIELLEGYGATETSPVVSVNRLNANRPGSIGKVLFNVKVRITDVNTGKSLSTGKEGKILVKGDLIMKGYFDDLEETSLRITDGWYDTGDMGVLDDEGFLWHKGRLKRFVKIGGEMVSLVKTESVLEELLPANIDCCIVEVPDPRKGARLIAAVTGEVDKKSLVKKMSEQLPSIAIPNKFIIFEELPKMGSGKMAFRQITDMVRKQISDS
ncbi:AMP-binding protein [bacterium]|nr:AMP-binding protein [bacterium]